MDRNGTGAAQKLPYSKPTLRSLDATKIVPIEAGGKYLLMMNEGVSMTMEQIAMTRMELDRWMASDETFAIVVGDFTLVKMEVMNGKAGTENQTD